MLSSSGTEVKRPQLSKIHHHLKIRVIRELWEDYINTCVLYAHTKPSIQIHYRLTTKAFLKMLEVEFLDARENSMNILNTFLYYEISLHTSPTYIRPQVLLKSSSWDQQ